MSDTPKTSAEETKADAKKKDSFSLKNRIIWTVVFIVIAALSVWAGVAQSGSCSFKSFFEFVKGSNPWWLLSATLSMLGFIIFEGIALIYVCRAMGYKTGFKGGFVYSAADIYVSAITPSATGGQPASAYFMIKDGLPGTVVTAALICNLVMYTSAIVVMGGFAVLVNPTAFFGFGTVSKILIIAGIVTQLALLSFFIMLLTKKGLMQKLCAGFVKLLGKLHIIRKVDKTLAKLQKKMDEYSEKTDLLKGKGKLLLVVFIFNLLQRISQVAVTPLTYLASGGELKKAFDVFITQIYVLMGANCVPIPGAVGVTDYLMLDGFQMMGIENYEFLELFSRFLSFYMCIIICGITLLFSCISYSDKRRNRKLEVKKYDRNLRLYGCFNLPFSAFGRNGNSGITKWSRTSLFRYILFAVLRSL